MVTALKLRAFYHVGGVLLPGEQKALADYIDRCLEGVGAKLLFDPMDRRIRIYPETISEEWKKRCQPPVESIFEEYPLKAVDADYLRSVYEYVPLPSLSQC